MKKLRLTKKQAEDPSTWSAMVVSKITGQPVPKDVLKGYLARKKAKEKKP